MTALVLALLLAAAPEPQACTSGSCQGGTARSSDPVATANNTGLPLAGDVTTAGSVATLAASGTPVGTFGSTTQIPAVTVDLKGRVTNISNQTPSLPATAITSGGLTQAVGGTGRSSAVTCAANDFLTSNGSQYSCATPAVPVFTGDVTTAGTVATLATSGVTANVYGSTSTIPQVTFDAKGRATLATSLTPALPTTAISSGVFVAARGALGAVQPTCAGGDFLTCNGTTCSCATPTSTITNQHTESAAGSGSCGAGSDTQVLSLTVGVTGTYMVIGGTSVQAALSDSVVVKITKNAVGVSGAARLNTDNGAGLAPVQVPVEVSVVVALTATDVVRLTCAGASSAGVWSSGASLSMLKL